MMENDNYRRLIKIIVQGILCVMSVGIAVWLSVASGYADIFYHAYLAGGDKQQYYEIQCAFAILLMLGTAVLIALKKQLDWKFILLNALIGYFCFAFACLGYLLAARPHYAAKLHNIVESAISHLIIAPLASSSWFTGIIAGGLFLGLYRVIQKYYKF